MNPLPAAYGLPESTAIASDNPHGTSWGLAASGDQGEDLAPYDRYVAKYVSAEGYAAYYFYFGGQWSLGAN